MRRALVLAAVALVCALYLADLTGMGLVSKDEPRYADIGRAMARSGDWITPRLWGQPWFEKPALLYWMIAAGFKLNLGPELAPRLPIALLSVAFLGFFWTRLRVLWDARVAWYSTAILATSAGWLALSHVAVTDLPLAALFSTAVLLSMGTRDRVPSPLEITFAAGALGLAVLAKSLVPVVLFVPVIVANYGSIRAWLRPQPILVFLVVALPWHILCAWRNGPEFPRVLFLEHQLGRFTSPALDHPHRWWFYFPALLLLLYPWFPLLLIVPRDLHDRRIRTLSAVVVFGFVFFSISVNGLNTYLLPLMPAVCALMGAGLARSPKPQRAVILPVALLGALPVAARVLPAALAGGLSSTSIPSGNLALWLALAALGALLVVLLSGERGVIAAATVAAAAFLWFQIAAFPAIDAAASARPLWLTKRPECADNHKIWVLYGLYYYSGRILPRCD